MSREAWRDVCLEFYRNGEGKEVLEWYDALKTGGNSTMKVPKEFDLFTNIDFQDFDRIRNETRRLFHAENAQKNRLALEKMLKAKPQFVVEKDRFPALKQFIRSQIENVGAHPFLLGLKSLLRANLKSKTVVAWQVDNLVFVESGGSEFMRSAVHLLLQVLQFTFDSQFWYVNRNTTNRELSKWIAAFPSHDRFMTGPTGFEKATEISRPRESSFIKCCTRSCFR